MANQGIGQSKAAAGFGRVGGFTLHGVGDIENILDVIFLTGAAFAQLTVLFNASSPHAGDERATFLGWCGGAIVSFTVRGDTRKFCKGVGHFSQRLAGEPLEKLSGNGLFGIGKLLMSGQYVVEKFRHLCVVIKTQYPREHFARAIGYTQTLWCRFGSADFRDEGSFNAGGGVIDQCCL